MALLNYCPPIKPYLQIIYQDDDLLVLNKPAGLLSVPGKEPQHKDSLQLRAQRVFPTATVVHRLDMATSGIMLMALTKAAHREVSRQFENRLTSKRYLAWVHGQVTPKSGEINVPLICDWPNRPKQKVDFELGKPALTKYQVLLQYPQRALIELSPVTGRSHQLRVHCQWMGNPILGDKFYASKTAFNMAERLQLHAHQLKIVHPSSNQPIAFESTCPFADSAATDVE